MTSTTKSIVFSNKNQIESDHVKIEALSDKKELKKLVMKRRESRQQLNTITYKSRLTQKKLHKKTNAIFSIYGKNGIIP